MTQPAQGPVGLVVKLPFATAEEFLAKYGANITRGGIYLRARTVKAPGTQITLDLKLANGERLIFASAVVLFVTGENGQGVPGMGLKFLSVDAGDADASSTPSSPRCRTPSRRLRRCPPGSGPRTTRCP